MTFKARQGDRRGGIRFEVIGSLPCHLTTFRQAAVRNLSCDGLLLESPVSLSESPQTIQLESGEATLVLQARVLRTTPSSNGFMVAMQFIEPDPASVRHLRRMLSQESDGD